jgi:hypothetical protein
MILFLKKKEYQLEDYFFEIKIHHKKQTLHKMAIVHLEKSEPSMKTTNTHTHTHKALTGQIGPHPRDKIKLNYKGWGL